MDLWCLMPLSVYIMAVSFIDGGNKSVGKTTDGEFIDKLYQIISAGFELATLVAIGTDCIGSCKSNYHTITDHKFLLIRKINQTLMSSPY